MRRRFAAGMMGLRLVMNAGGRNKNRNKNENKDRNGNKIENKGRNRNKRNEEGIADVEQNNQSSNN